MIWGLGVCPIEGKDPRLKGVIEDKGREGR